MYDNKGIGIDKFASCNCNTPQKQLQQTKPKIDRILESIDRLDISVENLQQLQYKLLGNYQGENAKPSDPSNIPCLAQIINELPDTIDSYSKRIEVICAQLRGSLIE